MNAIKNLLLPVDVRKSGASLGFAEKVFLEVLMSKLFRVILGIRDRGILELTAVHYISQPIMGGFMAPFSQPNRIDHETYVQALQDGAMGVPAVFLAQYIVNTSFRGLHIPGISMKDAFVTAASKVITRPVAKFVIPRLGQDVFEQFQTADEMVRRQAQMSNIKRK